LPDHIAVLLRFLGANHDAQVEQSLIRDSLLPALRKMAAAKPLDESRFPSGAGPYVGVERALLLVLGAMAKGWKVEANAGGVNG